MARRPSTQLFQLIHNLSPSERGYIRKALANPLGRKAGSMLALYDVICAASSASDPKIERFLADVGSGSSQLKRNLYDQILRSLRTISAESSDRARVLALLQESTLLIDRSLPIAARERLLEAESICERSHLFSLWSEVVNGLIRLERVIASSKDGSMLRTLIARRTWIAGTTHDIALYGEFSSQLLRVIHDPKARKVASTILADESMQADRSKDHVRVRFWQLHVRAMAHHVVGDLDAQDADLSAMVNIIRKHPVFLTEDVAITVLSNVLTTQIQRRDTRNGRATLKLLHQIEPSVPRMADDLWYNVARGEAYLDMIDGNYQRIINAEQRIVAGIEHYPINGAVVHRAWKMLASAAYVHLGKPEKALALVRTILDEPGLPESQYTAPRCIEIMALIDAEETEVALYRIRSLERAIASTLPDRPLMKALIKTFKALASDRKKAQPSIAALRSLLHRPIDEAADRTHRVTLGLDDWIALHSSR